MVLTIVALHGRRAIRASELGPGRRRHPAPRQQLSAFCKITVFGCNGVGTSPAARRPIPAIQAAVSIS